MSTDLKTQICDSLAAFIRQRPGLNDAFLERDATYRQTSREVSRDKRDAEILLQAVRARDSITAEDIIEASKHAFSGRLTITATKRENVAFPEKEVSHEVKLDYCTGQYWPTEYRKAVAAVCASALWDWQGKSMPAPVKGKDEHECYPIPANPSELVNAGEWLRRSFRREFGSKIQRRWFN